MDSQAILLTQKQLEHRLHVSPMTIYLWRNPSAQEAKEPSVDEPLPTVIQPKGVFRHSVYYNEKDVREWLVRNRPAMVDSFDTDECMCKKCSDLRVDLLPTVQNDTTACQQG